MPYGRLEKRFQIARTMDDTNYYDLAAIKPIEE